MSIKQFSRHHVSLSPVYVPLKLIVCTGHPYDQGATLLELNIILSKIAFIYL